MLASHPVPIMVDNLVLGDDIASPLRAHIVLSLGGSGRISMRRYGLKRGAHTSVEYANTPNMEGTTQTSVNVSQAVLGVHLKYL